MASVCHLGLFHLRFMPMGLLNASQLFQKALQVNLEGVIIVRVKLYIYSVITCSFDQKMSTTPGKKSYSTCTTIWPWTPLNVSSVCAVLSYRVTLSSLKSFERAWTRLQPSPGCIPHNTSWKSAVSSAWSVTIGHASGTLPRSPSLWWPKEQKKKPEYQQPSACSKKSRPLIW